MSFAITLGSAQNRITAFHHWRERASLATQILMAFAMAALTGLAAQIVIPLPGTPVPITGQTLVVLLTGVVLGGRWGAISQSLYVGLGVVGIPWFAGAKFGTAMLFGATGGYLFGFILAAFFVGRSLERHPSLRSFFPLLGVFWFASFVLIQVPGLAVLAFWMKTATGNVPALSDLLNMGFLPFVPGDVVKILTAATLAKALRPA